MSQKALPKPGVSDLRPRYVHSCEGPPMKRTPLRFALLAVPAVGLWLKATSGC